MCVHVLFYAQLKSELEVTTSEEYQRALSELISTEAAIRSTQMATASDPPQATTEQKQQQQQQQQQPGKEKEEEEEEECVAI